MQDFRFVPSNERGLTDDRYQLIADPDVTVWVSRYKRTTTYLVSEYGQDDPADPSTFWTRDCGEFWRLNEALDTAREVHMQRRARRAS
jgi:hypothetical protein